MSSKDTIGEALVMAKIEIRLRAVVEHVNFPVLKRVHRSWINIQIRIEFLENNAQTTRFKQCAERGCGQAFT